ncbi:MAG: HPP family protein [Allorhizobium sp.]
MSFLHRLNPSIVSTSYRERARASLGALIGISLTGLVSTLALGDNVSLPLLVAPMGASAVLLFAAPTSPLAQPWSILGGNTVAALVGVTLGLVVPDPLLAASLAVALSIAAMLMLNCLHPPSGAVALTAVLGGASIHDAGYWFVLSPVGINSALLVLVALLFNNATGRRYPHLLPARAKPLHGRADELPTHRSGVTLADMKTAIADYDEIVNLSPEELEALLHKAQIRAFARSSGEVNCADIMSRDVLTVTRSASLRSAWRMLVTHQLTALPVVTASSELEGLVTIGNFVHHAAITGDGVLKLGLRNRMHAAIRSRRLPESVADIMTSRVATALPETPIGVLVSPMADQGVHLMPIVDHANRLIGVVTQSDLLAALFESRTSGGDTASPAPVPPQPADPLRAAEGA